MDDSTTDARAESQVEEHARLVGPFVAEYPPEPGHDPERLHGELFGGPRTGPLGLLRDLHDLYLMATECDIIWTLLAQAAQGARDVELLDVVQRCEGETARQMA